METLRLDVHFEPTQVCEWARRWSWGKNKEAGKEAGPSFGEEAQRLTQDATAAVGRPSFSGQKHGHFRTWEGGLFGGVYGSACVGAERAALCLHSVAGQIVCLARLAASTPAEPIIAGTARESTISARRQEPELRARLAS
ncbi:hypothetical protein AAFF_G00296810 [Aldrovandia affinis]|uniref:Uncharacterized protein n=1 Tax=Aldrovandia affinis TaxID=143900 RepID=A0AAD7SQI1_9TELE|nr:hypothetical protein AAFF_G00296810 [Aldrovandia affinis]